MPHRTLICCKPTDFFKHCFYYLKTQETVPAFKPRKMTAMWVWSAIWERSQDAVCFPVAEVTRRPFLPPLRTNRNGRHTAAPAPCFPPPLLTSRLAEDGGFSTAAFGPGGAVGKRRGAREGGREGRSPGTGGSREEAAPAAPRHSPALGLPSGPGARPAPLYGAAHR